MRLLIILSFIMNMIQSNTNTYVGNEIKIFEAKNMPIPVLETYRGPITAYGPDCVGCIGITSSGYNVLDGNIYYNDKDYGKIRIVAADKRLPFGTIIRIKNVFDNDIIAIVLDRGSAIGFDKHVYFDLLYKSEKETEYFGKKEAVFEVLRQGF